MMRLSTLCHTPSRISAARAYLPAGTLDGSPVAMRPRAPSAAASGNPGPILSFTGLSAGATSTSRLPTMSRRVPGSISLREAR
ncbi:MAG: hypothetical protein IPH71_02670 [Proteobacteria bacterium]|nr:hypothetical protein [Pseudomonadota bacterium]